jgi:hypothetical protein
MIRLTDDYGKPVAPDLHLRFKSKPTPWHCQWDWKLAYASLLSQTLSFFRHSDISASNAPNTVWGGIRTRW